MPKVTFRDKQLFIDDQPTFLRCGEIQYFRIPCSQWPKAIERAKEAGFNAVASYVPWVWHEVEEDKYDFSGETLAERNLVKFLEIVKKAGLYFIFRPGPNINSELKHSGYPHWFFENHPEMISRNSKNEPAFQPGHGNAVPRVLYKGHLDYVFQWYEAVVKAMYPFLKEPSPIILSQVDNETCFSFTFNLFGSLFDPEIIDKGKLWHQWLSSKYNDIKELNHIYQSSYNNFEDIAVPRDRQPGDTVKCLDWLFFKEECIFMFHKKLYDYLYELGLCVPVIINEPVNGAIVGGDHSRAMEYYRSHNMNAFTAAHTYLYGGEMNLTGVATMVTKLEMTKSAAGQAPPISMELSGSWYTWLQHFERVSNWDTLLKTLVGNGMNGYSVFTFFEGKSAPGMAFHGTDYDWVCPVNAKGEKRLSFDIIKKNNEFFQSWEPELLQTKKQADIYGTFSTGQAFLRNHIIEGSIVETQGDTATGTEINISGVHQEIDIKEVARTFCFLNLAVEWINLDAPGDRELTAVTLFVPNPGVLPAKAFDYLIKLAEQGVNILFFPTIPSRYPSGAEDDRLLKLAGVEKIDQEPVRGQEPGNFVYHLVEGLGTDEIPFSGSAFTFKVLADAEVLSTLEGKVFAFARQYRNKSTIGALGGMPLIFNFPFAEYISRIFNRFLSKEPVVSCDKPGFHAVLREGKKGNLLTIINYLGLANSCSVTLRDSGVSFPIELEENKSYYLWTDLDLGQGTILRYCNVPVLKKKDPKGVFYLDVPQGTKIEMAFNKPVPVLFNKQALSEEKRASLFIYRAEAKGKDEIEIKR